MISVLIIRVVNVNEVQKGLRKSNKLLGGLPTISKVGAEKVVSTNSTNTNPETSGSSISERNSAHNTKVVLKRALQGSRVAADVVDLLDVVGVRKRILDRRGQLLHGLRASLDSGHLAGLVAH